MAFYGESTVVDEFVHEGVDVQIHKALKGPVHCDLPHEVSSVTCDGCGAKIRAAIVYFIVMNNAIIDGLECSSESEARELAVDYVSHLVDGKDRGEPVDEDITIDFDNDDEADTLPPPPKTKTKESGGADWGIDTPPTDKPPSPELKIMRQLNWPGKITEIFERLGIK